MVLEMTDPLLAKYEERIEREIVGLFMDGLLKPDQVEKHLANKASLALLFEASRLTDDDIDEVFVLLRASARAEWIAPLLIGKEMRGQIASMNGAPSNINDAPED